MNDFEIVLLIICMALVTYIPRVIPVMFIGKIKISSKVEKFLKLIPYTAMAALIFPGVLNVDKDNIWIGICGGGTAVVLSYFKCPVMISVVAAILVNMFMYMIW